MLKKWGLLGQADTWRGPESCRSPCSLVTLAHILGQASPFPPLAGYMVFWKCCLSSHSAWIQPGFSAWGSLF